MKKLFNNIKNRIQMEIINRVLAQLLDKFRAKNPVTFGVILAVLVALKYGIEALLGQVSLNTNWEATIIQVYDYIIISYGIVASAKIYPTLKKAEEESK